MLAGEVGCQGLELVYSITWTLAPGGGVGRGSQECCLV